MRLIMMSGYNVFDDFDFMTWASQDFLEHNGLFTYEDALTQFENLHSVEASFARLAVLYQGQMAPQHHVYDH